MKFLKAVWTNYLMLLSIVVAVFPHLASAQTQIDVTNTAGTSTNVGYQSNATTLAMPVQFNGGNAKTTYFYSFLQTTLLSGDNFVLQGSSTKTVRISNINCTESINGTLVGSWLIRSTADSSGTSAAVTAVPADSNNAAATSSAALYSVAPSTGTLVGRIEPLSAIVASGNSNFFTDWNFGQNGQEIVLRGTSQELVLNITTNPSSSQIGCGLTLTEE